MSNRFHAGGGYFLVGAKFDSRNRYIRGVANFQDKTLNLARGQSLALTTTQGGQAAWTWQCGPAVVQSNTSVTPPSGFNVGLNIAI